MSNRARLQIRTAVRIAFWLLVVAALLWALGWATDTCTAAVGVEMCSP